MENKITYNIMSQYEIVRRLGRCNMFNYPCVIDCARMLELNDLANLNEKEYVYILENFSDLMIKFNINQNK